MELVYVTALSSRFWERELSAVFLDAAVTGEVQLFRRVSY